jgi:hypothetical protein
MMRIRVDDSKVHELTSKISGVQKVRSFKPFKSFGVDELQGSFESLTSNGELLNS